MLPPGQYELSVLAKADNLENERGLVWTVACAEADQQALGETEPIRGTVEWHRISARFAVPDAQCRAQWLTLVLPAKAALEEQIAGSAWFDDVQVGLVEPGRDSASGANN